MKRKLGFRKFRGVVLAALAAGTMVPDTPAKAATGFPIRFIDAARSTPAPASNARFRVLGGEVAAPGAWPWQVALVSASKPSVYDGQFCGGSMVTRQWVLTAAHCVYDEKGDGSAVPLEAKRIKVLVGTNQLKDGSGELIEVADVRPHPDYNPTLIDNDLALVRLARPPKPGSFRTVKLPTRSAEETHAVPGAKVTVTGWGRLQDGKFPIDLRQVDIRILARKECNDAVMAARSEKAQKSFKEAVKTLNIGDAIAKQAFQQLIASAPPPLTENMVCSGTYAGGKGSCNGDSGGPLVVALQDGTFLQVGIVSWGFSSADDDNSCEVDAAFSAYTRVSNYIDWMKSVVENP